MLWLRTKGEVSNDLIFYILKHSILQLKSVATGTKFSSIIRKTFDEVKIPIPTSKAIRDKIVAECEAVDAACTTAQAEIKVAQDEIVKAFDSAQTSGLTVFRLSDPSSFEILIGQRVVASELEADGKVPIYSANVFEPFGYFNKLLIDDFSCPSILWGIDGDWMVNFMPAQQQFYPTDHCGVLRVKTDAINPRYLVEALHKEGIRQRFSRTLRASTQRIKGLSLSLPPRAEQDRIIAQVERLEAAIATARRAIATASAQKSAILKKWLEE